VNANVEALLRKEPERAKRDRAASQNSPLFHPFYLTGTRASPAAGARTTNDKANHRIAFLAVPGLSDDADKTSHNGMHHCAFEFDCFEDLMSHFDVRKAGIEPAFCLDHGMTISLYYKDPEGDFVERQSDVFSNWKLSMEYMRTSPEFAENPIGVFFRSGTRL